MNSNLAYVLLISIFVVGGCYMILHGHWIVGGFLLLMIPFCENK